jgi:hypothetical protein
MSRAGATGFPDTPDADKSKTLVAAAGPLLQFSAILVMASKRFSIPMPFTFNS